ANPSRQKPLPAPPATPDIPTTNPSPRDVKLPNNPNRHRLQTTIQYINPVVGQRTPDRDARIGLLTFHSKSNCIDRGFGRTVKIGDARNLEMVRNLLLKRSREDLTSQHQVVQRGVVRSTGNDRVQIRRYATHKSDVIPDQLMPELSGRFPYRVTDNDRCPAPMSGSSACSIEASKAQEMTSADRKLLPTLKSRPNVRILLARLACSTATPLGVPVEPEV